MNLLRIIKDLFLSKEQREAEKWLAKKVKDSEARRELSYPFTCNHCSSKYDPDICEACPKTATHWAYYDFDGSEPSSYHPTYSKAAGQHLQGRHFFIRCKAHHASCEEHLVGKPCAHFPLCTYIITTKEDCLTYLIMNG